MRETILHALTDAKELKESAKFGETHVSKIVNVMHGGREEDVYRTGFKECKSDPCVYLKETSGGPIYLATVLVDDLLIVRKDFGEANIVKSDLEK